MSADARIDSNGRNKTAGSRSIPPPDETGRTHDACEVCANRVGLIGRCVSHRQLLLDLYRAAQFDAEVLLFGETGVGKELYARYVHECSPRSSGEFVAVNCAAIPDSLFENEMFGHSAGAYTDAKTRSEGLVAAANGGTLFLDEVNELTKTGQVKLLRLLQEKEYRRLGEARVRRADVRVISAMNCNPQRSIEAGQLRQDLF
jgi:transcriptional regulator with PAS, ATPase and Fis domain